MGARRVWLAIALVVVPILAGGSHPASAAQTLTLELHPPAGPNGTAITLVGRGAPAFAEVGYIHGGFGELDECRYNTTSGQGVIGNVGRADSRGMFSFTHRAAEHPSL